MKRKLLSCLLFLALAPARLWSDPLNLPFADPGPALNLMALEIARSTADLKLDNFSAPYFVAYRLTNQRSLTLISKFGSLAGAYQSRQQQLYAEVRYGDYALDNTGQYHEGAGGYASLDMKPDGFRQALWILTDLAYKSAIADYLEKKAKQAEELDREMLPDFSTAAVARSLQRPAEPPLSAEEWGRALNQMTLGATQFPHLTLGQARLDFSENFVTFLNSEGTRLAYPENLNTLALQLEVSGVAPDGMQLSLSRRYFAPRWEELPALDDLKRSMKEMALEVKNLQSAPVQKPVTAPAILDPKSSAVLMHEALGHRLEGERQREEGGQTFKNRMGKAILPDFINIIDDPTMKEFQGTGLNGYFPFDAEGVASQRVVLVEKGVLKNFLLSRRPAANSGASNGHGRASLDRRPMGRIGNLILQSLETTPVSKLKLMLLAECRRRGAPYGFLIRRASSGDTATSRQVSQVLRFFPEIVIRVDAKTGEETLVRGVYMLGTPLVTLRKIIAAGDDPQAVNAYCDAESGTVMVSHIAPSLLLEEVELERLPDDRRRPPILKPPFSPETPQ
ncbi:MAG: hypothetical protein A3G41_02010 [Elusimicrobia bacterium RIFCSPLOWO2_12_FULL_59_9]|nr:MAG: hypothetical protein A3G41_02010 [Elusimicrobia bacterium RIFCSPLOWO2_12_FULL_59_9]